jgi:hypothetical protein
MVVDSSSLHTFHCSRSPTPWHLPSRYGVEDSETWKLRTRGQEAGTVEELSGENKNIIIPTCVAFIGNVFQTSTYMLIDC